MSRILRTLSTVVAAALVAALPATAAFTHSGRQPASAAAHDLSLSSGAPAANPFLNRAWGVYKGYGDQSWRPYISATGSTQATLGYIALKPKAKWFGQWIPDGQIQGKVRDYVTNSQAGNPDALVQMTIFRIQPWEDAACRSLPTAAQISSYKRWINGFAAGVGDAVAAIVLQPDGPFALCAPHGSRALSNLVAYGARVLSALPRTSVYIEAGAADWPDAGAQGGPAKAATILLRGGIAYARGFALNGTHYSSTAAEVQRATDIAAILARHGYPGKKAVINTAENGHPFEFGHYTGSNPDNARVCPSRNTRASVTCVTLGIPPTADVASTRWHLSATTMREARAHVDAYLWFGRPWLYNQADPFVASRALQLVASTPYR